MADRPIIFQAPMIRALLDGDKTQARRLADGKVGHYVPVKPGDRLWVQETWATWMHAPILPDGLGGELSRDPGDWLYQATATGWDDMDHDRRLLVHHNTKHEDGRSGNYVIQPSIHMPRWASRLTLVVTEKRLERVQDISEEDAKAEGVLEDGWEDDVPGGPICTGYVGRLDFENLWVQLHSREAWDDNPEVVALTFTVHKANIDALETEAAAHG